jgi:hypothetical protein
MMSRSKTFRRIRRFLLLAPLVVVALLVILIAAFAIGNLGLPEASLIVERLDEAEKARLAEAFHLRESLGERIGPGWGGAVIPIVFRPLDRPPLDSRQLQPGLMTHRHW